MLDSWLTLVSRLSNSETLMDSPHSLPQTSTATGFVPFHPINFLVATQKVHMIIFLYIVILSWSLGRYKIKACLPLWIYLFKEWKFIQFSLTLFIQVYHKLVHFLALLPCPSPSSFSLRVPFLPFHLSPSLPSSFYSLYSSLCHSFLLPLYIYVPTYRPRYICT